MIDHLCGVCRSFFDGVMNFGVFLVLSLGFGWIDMFILMGLIF